MATADRPNPASDNPVSERWVNCVVTLTVPMDVDPDSPSQQDWMAPMSFVYDALHAGDKETWDKASGLIHAEVVIDGEPEATARERTKHEELLREAWSALRVTCLPTNDDLIRRIEDAL